MGEHENIYVPGGKLQLNWYLMVMFYKILNLIGLMPKTKIY